MHVLSLIMIELFTVIRLWTTRPDRSKFTNKIQPLNFRGLFFFIHTNVSPQWGQGGSRIFLTRGAPLRNGAADWWGRQIYEEQGFISGGSGRLRRGGGGSAHSRHHLPRSPLEVTIKLVVRKVLTVYFAFLLRNWAVEIINWRYYQLGGNLAVWLGLKLF